MWWVIFVALVSAAFAGVRAWVRDGRQRALFALCRRSGVAFSALDPFPDTPWLPFPMFGAASRPQVCNVVWDPSEHEVRAFDLGVVSSPDGESGLDQRRWMSCAVIPLRASCPPIAITTRSAADPSGIRAAGSEVPLELDGFNRRFRVLAEDARAAVAFCDQRLMRTLLGLPIEVTTHVNAQAMILVAPLLDPGQVLVLLESARGLARAVPTVMASLYPPRPTVGPHETRWLKGAWSPEPTGGPSAG